MKPATLSSQRTPSLNRHSHRPPSVADSMAEYFDASEVIVCETSSEAEASDESGLSDITTTSTSEPEEGHGRSGVSSDVNLEMIGGVSADRLSVHSQRHPEVQRQSEQRC